MANHFLVFIGGTGAKCAEAFVQLADCGAMGGPENTYHILTLDVDATNGNRMLAIEALARYRLLREQFPATGQFAGSTLLGPNLVHYDWHVQLPDNFPNAAGVNCLHAMRAQNNAEEETLMRLLYTDEEMGFDFPARASMPSRPWARRCCSISWNRGWRWADARRLWTRCARRRASIPALSWSVPSSAGRARAAFRPSRGI